MKQKGTKRNKEKQRETKRNKQRKKCRQMFIPPKLIKISSILMAFKNDIFQTGFESLTADVEQESDWPSTESDPRLTRPKVSL